MGIPHLQLISGVVADLQVAQGYEDLIFTQSDKNLAGAAAVGAAAVGQLFNSAVLANASMGAEIDMEFFTCTVNGIPLAGRFHKVEFKEGEAVEFVVEKKSAGAVVHAARSPSQRMLWMLPYQTRGYIAQKRSDIKWSLILSTMIPFGFTLGMWFYLPVTGNEPIWIFPTLFFSAAFMILFVNFMIRRRFYGFSKEATEVLSKLGYDNPAEIDLNTLHKKAQKKLHQETGQLPPLVQPWSFRY